MELSLNDRPVLPCIRRRRPQPQAVVLTKPPTGAVPSVRPVSARYDWANICKNVRILLAMSSMDAVLVAACGLSAVKSVVKACSKGLVGATAAAVAALSVMVAAAVASMGAAVADAAVSVAGAAVPVDDAVASGVVAADAPALVASEASPSWTVNVTVSDEVAAPPVAELVPAASLADPAKLCAKDSRRWARLL